MEQFQRSGVGAVEQFDLTRFGGPTTITESHISVTAKTRILKANPDRIMVIIQNNGADAMHWSTLSGVSTTNGFQLGNAQQAVFQVQNDGALCSSELWAITDNLVSELQIIELTRQRPG